ncbi:MAG TPA: hypothetical protein VN026_10255 [Bacteroidia bacterium]|jgi:hypothetical protein|nr:hypothetical protein [Bacteroidia bacterium]
MEKRTDLIEEILKHFFADVKECARPLSNTDDRIYFIKTLMEYIQRLYGNDTNSEYVHREPFDERSFIDERLMARFRDKMIPFVKTSLKRYFQRDEFYQIQLFQKLKINEPILSEDEFEELSLRMFLVLDSISTHLYLHPTTTDIDIKDNEIKELSEFKSEQLEGAGFNLKAKWGGRKQQAILTLYVLNVLGITYKNCNVADMTRFSFALSGLELKGKIGDAHLYALFYQLKHMEFSEKDLPALEFVKSQFEIIKCDAGVELVEKEIARLRNT